MVLVMSLCHQKEVFKHHVLCLFRFHRLIIDDVKPEDAGDYTFVPDGYALSLSAKLNFLGETDVVIRRKPLLDVFLG